MGADIINPTAQPQVIQIVLHPNGQFGFENTPNIRSKIQFLGMLDLCRELYLENHRKPVDKPDIVIPNLRID